MKDGPCLPNMRAVRTSDYDFDLPPELIAQHPLPERAASRLLELDLRRPPGRQCVDRAFRDFPDLLEPQDLLVFNDTRVVPARLHGHKPSGGAVEMLLERPLTGGRALLHMRASKPLRAGQVVHTVGGDLVVEGRVDDLFVVRCPVAALEFFERYGSVPLPPYIARAVEASDLERYQSLLARVPGAVAAPTASLHFDAALLARIAARGVRRATITLHVGAGTFRPVRDDDIAAHRMHAEWVDVPTATCEAIAATRAAGGRVIAIGTTVVRALESAARASASDALRPWSGDTDIFIRAGFEWRVVDALVTNFHLPRSTLLMLVGAFAGHETVLAAYAHAISQHYRFFSYGDAMFIPTRVDRA